MHHAERLVLTAAALSSQPRTGYEISHRLFGAALGPTQRRFAVAETLSHLERLVREGAAARSEADGTVTYTGPQLDDEIPPSTSAPGSRGVTLVFELLGVGVLILLNAFFVAAEYGLVTARRTRIMELHHEGDRRARDVMRITGDPPRFIAAMQLGVTLTSLGIGALGEHALTKTFDPVMATVLAIALAYLILTFFHVVIGELVPKGVALGHSERTALAVSAPVRAFFAIVAAADLGPAALDRGCAAGARPATAGCRGRRALGGGAPHARSRVRRSTARSSRTSSEMLYKVFDFADKEAADVMVPRPEVVALSIDLPPEECSKR